VISKRADGTGRAAAVIYDDRLPKQRRQALGHQ
jgi:hypothetical protein